jgi:hypothetical protein
VPGRVGPSATQHLGEYRRPFYRIAQAPENIAPRGTRSRGGIYGAIEAMIEFQHSRIVRLIPFKAMVPDRAVAEVEAETVAAALAPGSTVAGLCGRRTTSTGAASGSGNRNYFGSDSGCPRTGSADTAFCSSRRYPSRVRTWYFCSSLPTRVTVILRQPRLGFGLG